MSKTGLYLLLGLLVLAHNRRAEAKNMLQVMEAWPNLSEAIAIINKDKLLPQLMKTFGFTAFIPTNEALEKYDGAKEKLFYYHLANIPYKAQDLPDDLNTQLTGNPRLYITRIPNGKPSISGWEDYDYYVNNAKITSANHIAQSEDGHEQVFHVVDQVIAPTIAKPVADGAVPPAYMNPDARKLLEKPNLYGLVDEFSITDFEKRVSELDLLDTFAMSGKNTFFIPINQALNDLIDKHVIHGHIVPKEVLFTRTVEGTTNQSMSLAFTDNLKVLINMEKVAGQTEDQTAYYVKSNTVAGDTSHTKGYVLARIVKGNIPVKNGVVHLIDRPLMIVASSIISYLQEVKGQLSRFYMLMKEYNPDMANLLVSKTDLTLFAPSNEAFKMVNKDRLNEIMHNKEKISKLLNLHILNRHLTIDEIIERTTHEIFQEETRSYGRKLYFAVDDHHGIPTVSLEGGGVNATITTPDIITNNGVIHIINRILGIPSQTVYEKLSTDPMLSLTFNLSLQEGWNERLKSREEKFTLFVPSNGAWEQIHRTLPSAYKKLFMGEFPYHVRYILERHMIVGHDFSLEELAALTTNSTQRGGIYSERLQMTRGKIYFQARVKSKLGETTSSTESDIETPSNTEYYIEWNGISARVIRPDVECVNGVVHVVDKVLMLNRDVTVSGGSTGPAAAGMTALLSTLITVAFARALHHH
ncbi:fasciclin-1 isoform X4 [Macrobrachium rosenbergii]|uniref:fasciclin-1 isoform X4 n=1 Tax=Macrobrachium rosenbergii TaxID=79674 RepID=UPI0034D691E0